jgi:hypothetical protein
VQNAQVKKVRPHPKSPEAQRGGVKAILELQINNVYLFYDD